VQQLASVLQQLQVMLDWQWCSPCLPGQGLWMALIWHDHASCGLEATWQPCTWLHEAFCTSVQSNAGVRLSPICIAATPTTLLLPASLLTSLLLPTQTADSAAAYSQALVTLEAAMSSSSLDPHGPLDGDWHNTWQQQWRGSLQRCQPPSWEAMALHLSMVGRHVVPRAFRMSRDAFLRAVEGSRWVGGGCHATVALHG